MYASLAALVLVYIPDKWLFEPQSILGNFRALHFYNVFYIGKNWSAFCSPEIFGRQSASPAITCIRPWVFVVIGGPIAPALSLVWNRHWCVHSHAACCRYDFSASLMHCLLYVHTINQLQRRSSGTWLLPDQLSAAVPFLGSQKSSAFASQLSASYFRVCYQPHIPDNPRTENSLLVRI